METKFTGKIITLSGVSGSGKSFLKKEILNSRSDFSQLMTVTTRKRRKYEKNGIDKVFLSEEEFKKQESSKEIFFTNKLFCGNWYAYRMADMEMLGKGINLIAEISYDSVEDFKNKYKNVISIYVLPYNIEKTIQKLKNRNMLQKEFDERVNKIKVELEFLEHNSNLFDFIITNNYTKKAVEEAKNCIDSIMKK